MLDKKGKVVKEHLRACKNGLVYKKHDKRNESDR